MHPIRPQLGEQARVVRDREHAEPVVVRHALDPAGDVAQRIDVQAGVDLVEHRELRLEHRELDGLGPLLLAAGELVVDAAAEQFVRDPERVRLRGDALVQIRARRARGSRARCPTRSSRRTPGTSTGYCIARNSPICARRHVGSPSSSSPSIVTDPDTTS